MDDDDDENREIPQEPYDTPYKIKEYLEAILH